MIQIKTITDVATELISKAQAKLWLKIETGDTADDDIVTALITGARIAAEQYCNKAFCTKTLELWTDEVNSSSYELELPYPPHQSITSVHSLDIEETKTALTLNTDYYKKGLTEYILIVNNPLSSGVFNKSVTPIIVKYIAGYLQTGEFQCPVEVVSCMKTIITNNYEFREDFQETSIALIPQDVKTRLNPFRHIAI